MESLLHNLGTDPLLYIGIALSGFAVLGFLTFLRGFIAGVGHIVGNSAHDEHQAHARARTIWGAYMLVVAFLLWETARFIASWFGYDTYNVVLGLVMVALLTVCLTIANMGSGGHH